MKIRALLVLFLLFAASARIASACVFTETGTPVCAFWTRADVVFLGKAIKVEDAPKNEGFPAGSRKVRFQVQQNFKGADNPTISVIIIGANADTVFNIKSGQTWIIYTTNDIVAKSFAVFQAVKTDPKIPSEEAQALKNIADGKSETAISGRLASAAQNGRYTFEPVEISVTGNGKRLTATTDADGAFNIPVPDGNYKVELKFPYKASFTWDENLLGTSLTEGVPTIFKYEVRLNDGDCNYNFFEITKK